MPDIFGSSWKLDSSSMYTILDFEKSRSFIEVGEAFRCKGKIENRSHEYATFYLIVRFADPYNHDNIIFDTDRDLKKSEKHAMRYEVSPDSKREFSLSLLVPESYEGSILDIQVELWSPGRLFKEQAPIANIGLFYREWLGSFEILAPDEILATVFISYAWGEKAYMDWIVQLAQELNRHRIKTILDRENLMQGREITAFMEQSLAKTPICICICSESYSLKADDRKEGHGGVAYEAKILTNLIMRGKIKAIPVLKANPSKKVPIFFGSDAYIDMDTEYWQGTPLTDLVQTIKNMAGE